MHYLLYGTGMQTWEYSPLYAIRSYAYLWLHALPACLHAHVLQTNKVTIVTSLSFQSLLLCLAFIFTLADLQHNWKLFTMQSHPTPFMNSHTGFYNLTLEHVQELQVSLLIVLQMLVFYFVRCVLAFSCCVCELYFYK